MAFTEKRERLDGMLAVWSRWRSEWWCVALRILAIGGCLWRFRQCFYIYSRGESAALIT